MNEEEKKEIYDEAKAFVNFYKKEILEQLKNKEGYVSK
jgi:hypothetical protein